MDRKELKRKLLTAAPLVLGILAFLTFLLYLYRVEHPPYNPDIILAGPVLSCIGLIISIITRRDREANPALWKSGLVLCLVSLIICVLIVLLLISVVIAMINGTWI